ncbi:phage-related minor tail protein [Rhodoligotrophos appendicifer]|uniref:phage tail tape measure protein n=1 Tax=Rhodoligotrophos appendicifer TaxID=987056 RepID=UPI001185786D|nr:phage tail tape measure protein [Rhodoligotrophos appendicifer]
MAERVDSVEVAIGLDASQFKSELKEIGSLAHGFERSLTRAFTNAASGGKSLSEVLRGLVLSLSRQSLTSALKPLTQGLGQAFGAALGGLTANAQGNAFSGGRLKAFADGGVVGSPTLFPMQGGVGLMGEAGAEAILPLARGRDGRLGVRSDGGGGPVQVTFNVTSPDVDGFRRAQGEIGVMLARALTRGRRNL